MEGLDIIGIKNKKYYKDRKPNWVICKDEKGI